MLVTGFGPFGSIQDNPSALLAEGCGLPYKVLEVSFRAVEDFLDEAASSSFDRFLLLGVSAGSDRFRVETVARNVICATPDVRGEAWGPGPISPSAPAQLGATLWRRPELLVDGPQWDVGVDAGGYLCNYIFFRALERLPGRHVGFLHVPGLDRVPYGTQADWLQLLLDLLGEP